MEDALLEQDKYKVFYSRPERYRTETRLCRTTGTSTHRRHRREDVSRSYTYHETTNRTVYAREK